ncbi:hypothetical protein AAFF_G00105030 [Aldrovandia affinis]|uniref:Uncharacterized protein n=1 Tax=Aldrovandia affinis TaxID=143900 RepID=A0AAD7T210_9TELE|nr:hypothetical protein AAFF_G00105030 [Aldrovandia affinis]
MKNGHQGIPGYRPSSSDAALPHLESNSPFPEVHCAVERHLLPPLIREEHQAGGGKERCDGGDMSIRWCRLPETSLFTEGKEDTARSGGLAL